MGGRLPERALADQTLRRADRLRARREEMVDDTADRAVQVLGDLVHQPDPEGGLRVEALAGEEVAARRAAADPREHERRDDRRDDPKAHLGEAEDGVSAGDDDVGAGHEARSPAESEALHPGNDRRRAGVDRVEHPVEAHGVRDVLVIGEVDGGALPLHVGSRTEARPLAGKHGDARVAGAGEGLGQLRDQRSVEGISPLRLGDRDAQDVALLLNSQRAHRSGA